MRAAMAAPPATAKPVAMAAAPLEEVADSAAVEVALVEVAVIVVLEPVADPE